MIAKKNSTYVASMREIRATNRSSVLELIRTDGPISRSKISEVLQVSLPAVMRIVEGLIADGWVHAIDEVAWGRGRKTTLLDFTGSDHYIIGVDLGGTKIYGALADYEGKILCENSNDHHHTRAEESLELVFKVVDRLLNISSQRGLAVSGIGIGVPGIAIPETGEVSLAPGLGWDKFPLGDRLNERYHPYPIVVENDVNLAALGEAWFNPACGGRKKNLVLIAIGTGIGAGVIINGNIYSGVHHIVGEIGYLLLDRAHLEQRYPGFGAFEQVASGTGIADRARIALLGKSGAESMDSLCAEDVFNAARSHEPWAELIIAETVDYLAQAIAAVSLMYDPDMILLGGGVSHSADLLIDPILQRLDGRIPLTPTLRLSQLGYRATVLGAVMQLLRKTTHTELY